MSIALPLRHVAVYLAALSMVATLGPTARADTAEPSSGSTDTRARASSAAGTQSGRYVEAGRWLTDGRPNAIDVGPDGTVVVTQATVDKASRFDPRGNLINTFALPSGYPYGVAVDAGGYLHVTQYSGFDPTSQIHLFAPDGRLLGSYGVPSGASSQFSPWGLDTHPNRTVYIANKVGHDVQLVRPDGSWGGRLGGPGSGPGQFDGPRDVALGNGSLYVVDSNNRRIQRFDPTTGALQGIWGQAGYAEGQFLEPLSITVAPDGRVLVLDRSGPDAAVLNEFTATGAFLGRTTLPLSYAFDLAVDAAGAVYVTGIMSYPNGGWGVLKVVPSGAAGAAQANVAGSRLKAVQRRKRAALTVSCSAGTTRCAGGIRVVRKGKVLARGRYDMAAGSSTRVTVRLTPSARKLLRKRKAVKARLGLLATAGSGASTQIRLTR